jgi:tRNA G10  N-methylase Trm11
MKLLALLGRQPALGLAELESLFGADKIAPLNGGGALLNVDVQDVPFERLGGVIKLCIILKKLDTTDWSAIERYLVPACKEHSSFVPEGKLTIGLSALGMGVNAKQLERTSLNIKKAIKSTGRPVRIIPNKSHEMSTPQVLHNKLTEENGWELVLYRDGTSTILAQTAFVQDIDAYTARDQARPMRDARVGMLPPKLAQTIINLAAGPMKSGTILDPFCGTGVLLQEAKLMGYGAYGTDIEPRMVEYSEKNLSWLKANFRMAETPLTVTQGDATTTKWAEKFDTIACEGYLGLPFAHTPSPDHLQESLQASNVIAKGFLKNIASQVESGFRMCIGLPAWHLPNSVKHLPCIGELEKLGWKRVSFKHASYPEMIYQRDNQVVGRELVVLVKI